ncbi:MAG: hypothetical protein AAGF12_39420, partial [Myxococcota bacterium]
MTLRLDLRLATVAIVSGALLWVGCKSESGNTGGAGGTAAAGGTGGAASVLEIALSASVTELGVGEVTELSWTVSNAVSCEASGGWTGDKSVDGATERVAVFRDTLYTLTCRDAQGAMESASVEVTAFGRLMATTTVSPNPVEPGERALATIVVSNPSATPVDDVRVELQVPNGVEPLTDDDLSSG